MSLEAVRVKEEPEWVNSASAGGVSEAAARAGLYAGHEVKDELVVGPECLQPPDTAYAFSVSVHVEAVKSEHKLVLRDCSVKLERLVRDVTGNTWRTTAHDECSAEMCDQTDQKEAYAGKKKYRFNRSEKDNFSCDICETKLFPKVYGHGSADNGYLPSAEAFGAEQNLLRDCWVRVSRLPGPSAPSPCPRSPSTQQHHERAESHAGVRAPPPAPERHHARAPRTHQCDTCGKTFVYKRRLIKHIQLHSQERSRTSPKVSKIASQKVSVNKKSFICDKCGKQFPNTTALKVHNRIHTGEKPYTCTICKSSFSRSDHFKSHIEMHANEKSYTCEICGRQFARSDYLRKHKLIHKEKPKMNEGPSFLCEICGKQFRKISDVARHKICHDIVKRYICDVCQKQFARAEHFKRHKQIHSGDKKFSCDVCQKKFRELHHLTRHKRIHTGEKSHMCPICKRLFSDVGNLKQHIRAHTGIKPHTCEVCGKQFVRLDTFKAHTRGHTGEK